ncbi:MAG: hypothetical protein KJ950_01035 [Proteobacteria bacterium]|nr:hypothetical protein [Pseudomonadota bacterium]MBU1686241.1 hypothetical protein [Pseudomonadota bacterium]
MASCSPFRWLIIALLPWVMVPSLTFAATDAATANFTAWSGYWWPTVYGGLATGIDYDGHPAPLEKYDTLTSGISRGPATQWYLDNNYDPTAPGWYGFCGAWSAAAVSEDIDFQPSILDKVLYKVGDKKGLVTYCHKDDIELRENAFDPRVFHTWLLRYIKQGISFYAELDPSDEVWNYPVYRYELTSNTSGGIESVTCRIWYADDQVDPDFMGTKVLTKTYTYNLFKTGTEITGGEWTGLSVYDHPQQLVLPITQDTSNPYLDCDLIRDLARTRDDDLESEQTGSLHPGDYLLLLLDRDVYQIEADLGDTISLKTSKDLNAKASIRLQIRDATGLIADETFLTSTSQEIILPVTSPPYTLTFTADSYGPEGIYSLNFDLKKTFEFANPKIQKGFGWGGFAITNNQGNTAEKIMVVGYDQNGLPLATYLGPFTLAPGQKQTVLTSDFEVLPLDQNQLTGVKILASSPLAVMNLFGYYGKNMSCYGTSPSRSRLVIPDTSTSQDYSRSVKWGLYNPTMTDLNADLTIYAANGVLVDTTSLMVPANRALEYDANTSPFIDDENHGWVLVATENNGLIQPHTEWLENGVAKAEALGSLGINRSFFLPQVVAKGSWNQSLTLINVADTVNSVTLTLVDLGDLTSTVLTLNPFEKTTVEINGLFPGVSDSMLNRSAMMIKGEQDLAGFSILATSGDDLYYPLLDQDDISQKLTLPHVASNNAWWTGFALFNPSLTEMVSVLIEPTDNAGIQRSDLSLELTIPPQSKKILTIRDLAGSNNQVISHVTFTTISGPGLAGVYAIGGLNSPMISGTTLR